MSRVFGADFGAAGNTKEHNRACIKRRKKQRRFSNSGLKPLLEVVLASAASHSGTPPFPPELSYASSLPVAGQRHERASKRTMGIASEEDEL